MLYGAGRDGGERSGGEVSHWGGGGDGSGGAEGPLWISV